MARLAQLLEEKGFKSSEKLREECPLSDWEIAKTLFDNLVRKATKKNCLIENKTIKKTVRNNFGKTKVISKTKISKIRIPSVSLIENGVLFDSKALWVKPLIQKNRIVFFWKGIYIDGATIFGESINRYQ
jgi:polyhydroxyalkanoate synthesis regulator phasin